MNANEPEISVIIPVYNLECEIQRTLHCFCRQTFQEIEILCVDDGSSDGTVETIRKMQTQDSRIRLFQQEHQYAGGARNLGLSQARGRYVYFFDGDDVCEPDLLETVYRKAEDVDADVVIFDFCQQDLDTGCDVTVKAVREVHAPYLRGKKTFCYHDIPRYISELVTAAPWNKFYRKSYLKERGLKFSTLHSMEDLSFGRLSMVCARRIAYVERSLMTYHYTRRGSRSLSSKGTERWKDVIQAEVEMYQKARLLPQYEEIRPSLQLSCWTNLRWFWHQHFSDASPTREAQAYKEEAQHLLTTLPLFDKIDPETIRPDAYAEILQARGIEFSDQIAECKVTKAASNGILVYGVGAHLYDVLAWYPSLARCVSRIFDKNAEKVGTRAVSFDCVIESPDTLINLPKGTVVAISAIRYYDEIVRELHQINNGLQFVSIDDACENLCSLEG